MSRIGSVLLLALSLGSATAQADVPEAAAEAMLEKTVGFQLETYRGMLGAMDNANAEWRSKEQYAPHLEEAEDLLDQARSQHLAGDDELASESLGKAWRELAPAVKAWVGQTSSKGQRALMRTLSETTTERLEMMRSYQADLPVEAREALQVARERHGEAKSLRESSPAQALAAERGAIQALNRSFTLMWQDFEGDVADGDEAPAPTARTRR